MRMVRNVLMYMLLCASTQILAQSNAMPVDGDLVGTWEGEFPASQEVSCSAYKWTMTRKSDGTYRYHGYDDTQTIIDDEGRWWVDAGHATYFETVNTQDEVPTEYAYSVSQNNINNNNVEVEFKQIKPLEQGECSQTFRFSERKSANAQPKEMS
ncbi:hypothetical protein DFR44_11617 [Hydromonas duriensis]|uniref:Lipocalin-like protein n=2 Tax=Hydromonas duriensis TaxID=1527608 RepID=A0A4R6Y5R5_9BURK|nr:hypothetical protein DFR44_11617 [Hydromonas duriensis]